MKEENKDNKQMDIFTKGFVKPDEEVDKIEIEEEIEKEEIEENKEIEKKEVNNDIKYNNIQMKEKADELINELENQDKIREKK